MGIPEYFDLKNLSVKSKFVLALVALALSFVFFFQNCQPPRKIEEGFGVDPTAKPFIDEFGFEAEKRNILLSTQKLSVKLVDKVPYQDRAVAYCYKEPEFNLDGQWVGINPVVVIDKTFFNRSSDVIRRDLIMHELGHCLINRSHTETRSRAQVLALAAPSSGSDNTLGSTQLSIMNPVILSSYLSAQDYLAIQEKLLDELFSATQPGSGQSPNPESVQPLNKKIDGKIVDKENIQDQPQASEGAQQQEFMSYSLSEDGSCTEEYNYKE